MKSTKEQTIYTLNGPNLNLLGTREPHIYGTLTLADIASKCQKLSAKLGFNNKFLQSNYEGQLIDWIQQAQQQQVKAIIINPAAYTHTSIAILDALKAYEGIVVEVHLSAIETRESFRHHSYIALRADKVITGLGVKGYEEAILYIASV